MVGGKALSVGHSYRYASPIADLLCAAYFSPAHVLLRYMVSQHWAFFTAEINRFGTFRTAEQTDPYEVVRGVLSLVL